MKISPIDLGKEAQSEHWGSPFLVGIAFLPMPLQESVSAVQEKLRRVDPNHIFHPPTTLHITVKPIGAIGTLVGHGDLDGVKETFRQVSSKFESFQVSLVGLSVFPDVVYARVADGKEKIIELNKTLAAGLGGLALRGTFEGDDMIPHVTLATFAHSKVAGLIQEVNALSQFAFGSMRLECVNLVAADLSRYYGSEAERGNAFTRLETFKLGTS